jgi:hypothetical protein
MARLWIGWSTSMTNSTDGEAGFALSNIFASINSALLFFYQYHHKADAQKYEAEEGKIGHPC